MIRNCKNCGDEFRTFQSDINRGRGIYCSQSCHYEYANLSRNNNKGKEKKQCAYCKKEFFVFVSRSHVKHCSKECSDKTIGKSVSKWKYDRFEYGLEYQQWARAKRKGVVNRWKDFNNFMDDMGKKNKGQGLKVKDNSLLCSKENCYWG